MNAPLVKPGLLREIARYGAVDVSACFNCGNCSAVCPLSEGADSFPRRAIRLGQLGPAEALLASDEPWLCHHCGECTQTCPRQADPGEYMAAVRRWTIARLEPTGIGKLMLRGVVADGQRRGGDCSKTTAPSPGGAFGAALIGRLRERRYPRRTWKKWVLRCSPKRVSSRVQ